MAFSPLDLPIQEMLQTDFITDLSTIHNSNVLLLKDQTESLINNLEIDVNNRTIGTDNAIESIKTDNVIIQDDGFLFQKSPGNVMIAKLFKNGPGDSVLNVGHIEMNLLPTSSIAVPIINVDDINIANDITVTGGSTINGALTLGGSLVSSKETVSVLFENTGTSAEGTLTLTDTSSNNIYVTVNAETALGGTQVYNGAVLTAGIVDFKLIVDFDVTNPPAQNTTFTIHIVDVIENNFSSTIITVLNAGTIPLLIEAGTNQSTATNIKLHSDILGVKLGINFLGTHPLSSSLAVYNSNATFNYIIDQNLDDRLMITSLTGLELYV